MEQYHMNHKRKIYVHWHKIIIPLHPSSPNGIHAHNIFSVPGTHHKSVQLKIEGTKWICLRWDQAIHLRPPTNRCTRKQRSKGTPRTTWIFWSPPHPRIMETHHPPYIIFSGGRRLWSKIYQQSGRWSPHSNNEKNMKYQNTGQVNYTVVLHSFHGNLVTIEQYSFHITEEIPPFLTYNTNMFAWDAINLNKNGAYTE